MKFHWHSIPQLIEKGTILVLDTFTKKYNRYQKFIPNMDLTLNLMRRQVLFRALSIKKELYRPLNLHTKE